MAEQPTGDGQSAALDLPRFDVLLQHYYQDDLDRAMADELSGLLATHAQCRRDFVDLAQQQLAIFRIFRENRAIGAPVDAPQHSTEALAGDEPSHGSAADKRSAASAGLNSPLLGFLSGLIRSVPGGETIVGGLLLLAVCGALWGVVHYVELAHDERAPAIGPQAIATPGARVGSLAVDEQTRWSPKSSKAADRAVRVGDRYLLDSGQAQLQLTSGVCVAIEGPAVWRLASDEMLQLDSGRLAARVSLRAIGFAVVTPTAEVVDLGTEFGVAVEEDGNTEVHVLRGAVEVKKSGATSQRSPGGGVRLSAGSAVRVTAGQEAASIPFDGRQFAPVLQAVATAGKPGPESGPPGAGPQIWLGNLFDDPSGTPLPRAMQTDTFKATAEVGDLGIERVIHGGDRGRPVVVADAAKPGAVLITPGIALDLKPLGWQGKVFGSMTNDAWGLFDGYPSGGMSTRGAKIGADEPKIEEGIGMHADALVTFDLDELRAAGGLEGRELEFVCDRAGVNDDQTGIRPAASLYMAVLVSSDSAIHAAVVNGNAIQVSERDGVWSFSSSVGDPMRADGKFLSFRVPVPSSAKYLTLVAASGGDGNQMDHAAWSGARLEVSCAAADRK